MLRRYQTVQGGRRITVLARGRLDPWSLAAVCSLFCMSVGQPFITKGQTSGQSCSHLPCHPGYTLNHPPYLTLTGQATISPAPNPGRSQTTRPCAPKPTGIIQTSPLEAVHPALPCLSPGNPLLQLLPLDQNLVCPLWSCVV